VSGTRTSMHEAALTCLSLLRRRCVACAGTFMIAAIAASLPQSQTMSLVAKLLASDPPLLAPSGTP
jgi:hypothetical protein